MYENESLPWTDVYRHALDDHSRFIQLSDGLLGEASVSTFSEGYTVIFDLSGYTKIVKDLDRWGQMKLSEAIVNGALEFGKKLMRFYFSLRQVIRVYIIRKKIRVNCL